LRQTGQRALQGILDQVVGLAVIGKQRPRIPA
jgi:hypothetical protein